MIRRVQFSPDPHTGRVRGQLVSDPAPLTEQCDNCRELVHLDDDGAWTGDNESGTCPASDGGHESLRKPTLCRACY